MWKIPFQFLSVVKGQTLRKGPLGEIAEEWGRDRWMEGSQGEDMLNKESTMRTNGEQRQKQSEV